MVAGACGRPKEAAMGRLWRENGLSLVMFGLFAVCVVAQSIAGMREYNEDQAAHGQPAVSYGEYLTEGHFWEATFENWESEFLQMSAYVLLTISLFQKGSSESKTPDSIEAVDVNLSEPAAAKDAPWPVRKGGLILKLYENSLSIALLSIFVLSFAIHAWGGAVQFNEDAIEHGQPQVSTLEYIGTSRFWFESFQNWQSEFLSIGV